MLHSFVVPVIILFASWCIRSNCFLDSLMQLSHTDSLYSSRGRINAMHVCLLSPCSFRDRFFNVFCPCERVREVDPRCLSFVVSVSMVSSILRAGCITGLSFLDIRRDVVLFG